MMSLTSRLIALVETMGRELKPRITQQHAGVAKAWVSCSLRGPYLKTEAQFNVMRVVRLGAGCFRVWFKTPFAHRHYAWFGTAYSEFGPRLSVTMISYDSQTAKNLEVVCVSDKGKVIDPTELCLVVFADAENTQ